VAATPSLSYAPDNVWPFNGAQRVSRNGSHCRPGQAEGVECCEMPCCQSLHMSFPALSGHQHETAKTHMHFGSQPRHRVGPKAIVGNASAPAGEE